MNQKRVAEIIQSLFERAKAEDEFEYACTLLRIRGVESAGWDTLEETDQLFQDLTGLMNSPLRGDTRVRLALLLYSHLTEVDAIYLMLANLLRVIKGERYSVDPFGHLYLPKGKPRMDQRPPSAKSVVNYLIKSATEQKEADLAELLNWFFHDNVRNAFFHSDYTIHQDEFRSREAWFQQKDGTYSPSLKLVELMELVNRGLLFYQVFMARFVAHIRSYKADKEVKERFGQNGEVVSITLTAGKGGLYGFESIGGYDQV